MPEYKINLNGKLEYSTSFRTVMFKDKMEEKDYIRRIKWHIADLGYSDVAVLMDGNKITIKAVKKINKFVSHALVLSYKESISKELGFESV